MLRADHGRMPDPWLLTGEYLDGVERDIRPLLGPGVEPLLRPTLRPEHAATRERIAGLPWTAEPVEATAGRAFAILADATVAGGLVDPADDEADVPWCAMLRHLLGVPLVGSKTARKWFALLQRLRWADVPVSPISEGVAAYGVALMEHVRGRESEAWYWMRLGAVQNEDDDRGGVGVAVVVRAARLLTGAAPCP